MTDKVQKIKEWISKTQDGLMDDNGNFENTSDEGAFHILSNLDYYIDSLQEEPVSEELEAAAKKSGQKYFPDEYNIWARQNYEAKNAEYSFIDGAKWQKQQTIDKAAEWLKCAGKYHWYDPIEHNEGFGTDRLIEDFKKYMED